MKDFWFDVRVGLRTLFSDWRFALIATLALALGIGGSAAVFTVVHGLLMEPLPYPDSDRLVCIWNEYNGGPTANSPPDYNDRLQQSRTLSSVAALSLKAVNLSGEGDPLRLTGAFITHQFLPILGVKPVAGRLFTPDDDRPGNDAVIISSSLANSLGGDQAILGRVLRLDENSRTVVGVLPSDFSLPDSGVDVWIPLALTAEQLSDDFRGNEYLTVLGKMAPGTTLQQVEREMDVIAARVLTNVPERAEFLRKNRWGAQVESFKERYVASLRPALLILMVAVTSLFLIACVNVAILILSRAAGRRSELAVRKAIGASRLRLGRQLVTESLVLTIPGAVLGGVLAVVVLQFASRQAAVGLPMLASVASEIPTVAIVTVLISLAAGLLTGLIPAIRYSEIGPAEAWAASPRTSSVRDQRRTRFVLISAEVALAFVLLFGTVLLAQSLTRLFSVPRGFEVSGRLSFSLSLPTSRYDRTDREQFMDRLLSEIESFPEVQQVGATQLLPLSRYSDSSTFYPENYQPQPGEQTPGAEYRMVTPGYLEAMGIELVRGRYLTSRDNRDNPNVVLVNQLLAQRYWPGQDPIGKRISFDRDGPWREVVGVVSDVRNVNLETSAVAQIYLPYWQSNVPASFSVVLKTTSPPSLLAARLRETVDSLDPALPIYAIESLEQRIDRHLSRQRYTLWLVGLFSVLGLGLASVGIFGVTHFFVSQRIQELGIRIAVGAKPGQLRRMVVAQGLKPALTGCLLGVIIAVAAARVLQNLVYGTSAVPVFPLIGSAILLVLVAGIAAYIPARRATRLEVTQALREA